MPSWDTNLAKAGDAVDQQLVQIQNLGNSDSAESESMLASGLKRIRFNLNVFLLLPILIPNIRTVLVGMLSVEGKTVELADFHRNVKDFPCINVCLHVWAIKL